jgi:hypothetical protein
MVVLLQLAIMFGGATSPSAEETKSMLAGFQQKFASVCALLHRLVASGAGPTLQMAVSSALKRLQQACETFLADLEVEASLACTLPCWSCSCPGYHDSSTRNGLRAGSNTLQCWDARRYDLHTQSEDTSCCRKQGSSCHRDLEL